MLRFILKVEYRDAGHITSDHYTLDAECPELEATLKKGGWGGGLDGHDFERHSLVAVAVNAITPKAEKKP